MGGCETYENVRPDALGIPVGTEDVHTVHDADGGREHAGGEDAREERAPPGREADAPQQADGEQHEREVREEVGWVKRGWLTSAGVGGAGGRHALVSSTAATASPSTHCAVPSFFHASRVSQIVILRMMSPAHMSAKPTATMYE